MSPIARVIETVGLSRLARKIGVTYQAIRKWEKHGKTPSERVLPIHYATHGLVYHATRGAVTPHELRPDLYPDPDWLPLEPEGTTEADSSKEVA